MREALSSQSARLVLGFVLGAALGLAYDLLRPLRRRSGRAGAAALDAVFAVLAGVSAFVFAMGAGSGRMGVWELASALAGFTGYMHTLSDSVFALTDGAFARGVKITLQIKKLIKKIAETAKFLFQKARK